MKNLMLISLTFILVGVGCGSATAPIPDSSMSDFDKEATCIGLAQGYTNPDGNDFVLLDYCYYKDMDTCIAIIREDDPTASLFYALDLNHNKILKEWYNGTSGQFGSADGVFKYCN